MKLVLYGGGAGEDNYDLDSAAVKLTGKTYPQMTYIPSASFGGEVDFKDFVTNFTSFEMTKFIYFPVDIPFDSILADEAFKSDIIHLGGGNTFYFLHCLRKNKLISRLKNFVREGGVLTGLSAGAIMMTPTIETAGFPSFDCDENHEKLTNLRGLNLVKFEFFPHYRNSKRYDKELLKYSKKSLFPLFACSDGGGLVVEGDCFQSIGKTALFSHGKKIPFSF